MITNIGASEFISDLPKFNFNRRFSNFDVAYEQRARQSLRFSQHRSSVATTSGADTKRLSNKIRLLKNQGRTPTLADLNQINQNIRCSVSTLAEYSRFYEHEYLRKSQKLTSSIKAQLETGLVEKRPDDCIIITDDITYTERVRINISGKIFETYRYMLNRFSDGLLGDANKRQQFWDENRKEYYFDHSGECFEGIMQYYQSGILRLPQYTHLKSFIEALEFFQFSQETINKFKRREAVLIEVPPILPDGETKRAIWLMFEYPHSSRSAHIIAVFSVVIIIMSLIFFCCETLPQYTGQDCAMQTRIINGLVVTVNKPVYDREFFLLETFCVFWFTLELIVRFFTCPSKLKFILSAMNIIDFTSILPYFVTLLYSSITMKCPSSKGTLLLTLRALRVLRVFKLTRFSKGLRILTTTLEDSRRELFLVLFFVLIGAFIFAIMLYTIEVDYRGSQITSIVDGYWWAVITMTTVGYGDVLPQSYVGKLVGSVCIITGTVVLTLPAPIIVSNFNRYYRNETGRGFEDSDWLKRK